METFGQDVLFPLIPLSSDNQIHHLLIACKNHKLHFISISSLFKAFFNQVGCHTSIPVQRSYWRGSIHYDPQQSLVLTLSMLESAAKKTMCNLAWRQRLHSGGVQKPNNNPSDNRMPHIDQEKEREMEADKMVIQGENEMSEGLRRRQISSNCRVHDKWLSFIQWSTGHQTSSTSGFLESKVAATEVNTETCYSSICHHTSAMVGENLLPPSSLVGL